MIEKNKSSICRVLMRGRLFNGPRRLKSWFIGLVFVHSVATPKHPAEYPLWSHTYPENLHFWPWTFH